MDLDKTLNMLLVTLFQDIMDIEEFVKRYPIQVLYTKEHPNADELYEQLDKIKDKTTKGFIETRKNMNTMIFEIC